MRVYDSWGSEASALGVEGLGIVLTLGAFRA